MISRFYRVIVKGDQDISADYTSFFSRTSFSYAGNEQCCFIGQFIDRTQLWYQVNLLHGESEPGSFYFSKTDQLIRYFLRRIDADGKTKTLRSLYSSGINANHLTVCTDQRATRITGIECGIGLDHSIHH